MKDFAADLHIHTVLSPCADAAMRPPAIVEAALARGIGMIAICDHNATANIGAVREAAAGDLIVIAGIEITTVEEVHVLGWFGDDAAADAVAAVVRATLPARSGLRGALRAPEVVDALGAIVEHPDAAYESACALPLGHAVGLIRANGGIAVAAHAD
ncbi:MAG: PHP domain-containing protein, partial [Deltaproteobacteria bacterium]|nr:PHP domain-containing protein [Deltaproteobacteria bacterium]